MADIERVVSLITTIAADPSLRDRLAAASEEDRTAMIAELGFPDVTPADVAANAEAFMPRVIDELDDAALEAVAGGDDTTGTTTTVATGIGIVLGASAAAASAT